MMEVSSARILAVSDLTASEAKSLSYEPPTGVETSQTFAAELARVAWTKDARHDNVYTRPCFGQESSASFNQNVADGHTELSLALPFGINVDPEDLVRRASYAWRTIRRMHPECAIELTTGLERPQMMRYSMVAPGGHEEQEWLSETFIPIQGTRDRTWKDVVEMTYNRKLPTRGKRAMMYLVLAPQDSSSSRERPSEEEEELRQHCLIYNVAHAVTDGFSFVVFLNAYMQLLADAGGAAPPDSSSTLPPQDVLFRLPDSVLPAYVRRYHPSVSDREESLRHALEQMQLYAAKMPLSVALTPRADYTQRRHKTGCIVSRLAQDVSESVLKSLRSHQSRLSITYLGAAATILSILSLYGRGHEQGALLGMTRNARRWVETEATHSGTAAIPMATDVVYLWIDFAELDTSMTPESARVPSAELLIALGQRIKTALAPHLLSPHYMASISAMAEGFIDTLDTASRVPPGCESVGTQAPGFSPGGAWPVGKHFSSKDGRVALQRAWLYQYGRQVNPSPWISMCSIDGRLCLHCGYDERYYEADTMQEMLVTFIHSRLLPEQERIMAAAAVACPVRVPSMATLRLQRPEPPAPVISVDLAARMEALTTPDHGAPDSLPPPLAKVPSSKAMCTETWREKVQAAYARHVSLHEAIEPLLDSTEKRLQTEKDVFACKGRLTTRKTQMKRVEAQLDATHKEVKRRSPNLASKALMFPSRRSKLEAARRRLIAEQTEREGLESDMVMLQQTIGEQEEQIRDLKVQESSLAKLEQELDQLDKSLFSGPTPGWQAEDEAEYVVLVLQELQKIVSAEVEREARARQKLQRSLPPFEEMLGHLKKALAVTLDAGVPTNTKYTRQLFVNGNEMITARAVTPMVLSAKTLSGKAHTLFAEARGIQLLILPLPKLTLMDLTRVPGKGARAQEIYDERSMHSSLETSYAQAQAQIAHVKREVLRSKERTRFLKQRIVTLGQEEHKAARELRARRRHIVCVLCGNKDHIDRVEHESNIFALAPDAKDIDEGDDGTLGGDTVVEEEALRAGMEAETSELAGMSNGGTSPQSRSQLGMLQRPSYLSTESYSAENGSDVNVPYIRNPSLANAATAAVVKPNDPSTTASGSRSGSGTISAEVMLGPEYVTGKSVRALRRILKECVRHTNRVAGGIGAEQADGDLPTFWDLG
ncbi:unnamed protein product [Parajaminaea phylloscopi]